MSKPIKMTDGIMQTIIEEFRTNLMSAKLFDGKVSYSKNFKWEKDEKAVVSFSPVAFSKMLQLLYGFSSEVAWHGTVYRDAEKPNVFRVADIVVYPQLVSGSNVETDQKEYQTWLYSLDDETFNNLRMQGHSHVDFDTRPSSVDITHQQAILQQLDDDMFYVFMIWNKKMERTIRIFDLKNNTLYDKEDVIVTIDGSGEDMQAFIDGAKAIVKPAYQAKIGFKPGSASTTATTQKPELVTTPAAAPAGTGAPASRPKESVTKPPIGRSGYGYDPGYDDPEDYARGYYNGWGSGR